MAKERALRRAEREREAAIKAAARAAEQERRERKAARAKKVKARLPRLTPVGKHTGVLARRRRIQNFVLVDLLLVLNIVIWFVSGEWGVRLGALIVCVLTFPVLKTLIFPR
jgi:hypothetical protein